MLVEKKILSDHFEEIYVSWFSRMKYFALEYVVSEEDAENIVQDVFTELWERKEILAYDVNLVALLFTSIKNRCIDLLRHRIVVKEAVNLIQEEYQATLPDETCLLGIIRSVSTLRAGYRTDHY